MNIEIANRLVELRRSRGLSQEELAAKLGVSRQAVSKWERAESSPDTDNLVALARLYDVSLDALLLHSPGGGAACAAQPETEPEPEAFEPEDEEEAVFSAAEEWDAADEAYRRDRWRRRRRFLLCFPYPVLVVLLYLALGFTASWWHPGWMLFLTIPIYYCILGAMKD